MQKNELEIKADYLSGLGIKDLSEKYNRTYKSVEHMVARRGWKNLKNKSPEDNQIERILDLYQQGIFLIEKLLELEKEVLKFNLRKENEKNISPKIKKQVLNRDKFTCQDCGETRKSILSVHHIKDKKKFPELINDPANCITLCIPCHKERHKKTS